MYLRTLECDGGVGDDDRLRGRMDRLQQRRSEDVPPNAKPASCSSRNVRYYLIQQSNPRPRSGAGGLDAL